MHIEWRYELVVLTSDVSLGDQLYLQIRAFPDDPAPEQTVFQQEAGDGWFATTLTVKEVVHLAAMIYNGQIYAEGEHPAEWDENMVAAYDEQNVDGYPKLLLDAGYTTAQIDSMKNVVKISSYDLFPDGSQDRQRDLGFFDNFVQTAGI